MKFPLGARDEKKFSMKSNEYYKDPCTNEPNKGNPKKETNIGLPSIHKKSDL